MIVLPMAGLSSRFAKAGFTEPKYMLPLAGRPMLDWSILSFAADLRDEPVLFVYRDTAGTSAFVRERARACGVARPVFVVLDAPTEGQAETVALGLESGGVPDETPLTIFNIDTLRPGLRSPRLEDAAGLLEVVHAEGDHWSFVDPDPARPGVARRVTEKERVSDLCCTGLYIFRSVGEFRQALTTARPAAGELYVAPLYNEIIADGGEVRYAVTRADSVFFAGTPQEYAEAQAAEGVIARAFEAAAEKGQSGNRR